MLCYGLLCSVRLCYAILCDTMLAHVVLLYVTVCCSTFKSLHVTSFLPCSTAGSTTLCTSYFPDSSALSFISRRAFPMTCNFGLRVGLYSALCFAAYRFYAKSSTMLFSFEMCYTYITLVLNTLLSAYLSRTILCSALLRSDMICSALLCLSYIPFCFLLFSALLCSALFSDLLCSLLLSLLYSAQLCSLFLFSSALPSSMLLSSRLCSALIWYDLLCSARLVYSLIFASLFFSSLLCSFLLLFDLRSNVVHTSRLY